MVQVANQNQPLAAYAYNFMGQRAAKTTPSTVTNFLYDRAGHLLAESNGATGAAQTEYLWLDDMPLALVTGGNLYFIHPDHLNTPQKATDASQNLAWDAVLRPFGQTEQQTFPSLTNLRLPGQYFDAESGLAQNWFRDYDPGIGRYIESDPIGLNGGINTYAYVEGNPIAKTDELGLSPSPQIGGQSPLGSVRQCLGGDKCEEQYHDDQQVCRSLPNKTARQKGVRSRCWESALARFTACNEGKTVPPLVTWREGTDAPTRPLPPFIWVPTPGPAPGGAGSPWWPKGLRPVFQM